MPRQFNGRLTREALRAQLVGEGVIPGQAAMAQPAASGAMLVQGISTSETGTDAEQITDWLSSLHLLKGVPFNYLVPDSGMLPAESIRFFQIDNNWIEALLDGAYSIGFAGVAQATTALARPSFLASAASRARGGHARLSLLAQVRSRTAFTPPRPKLQSPASATTPDRLSGFLLRSAVVAGWPGLEAHGYSDTAGKKPLQIVRMEALSPSVLLCIFAGVLARVDLQEPSEAVHFGVDPNGSAWKKDLRYANGNATIPVGSYIGNANVAVNPRSAAFPSVLAVDALAQSMRDHVWTTPPPADVSFTSAQFALEMVEGVQAISFQIQAGS